MDNKIVRLRKGKKGRLREGHPWIFKGQILKLTSTVRAGDIVTVISNEGRFVGRGYFNPASEISIRLLTFNDEPIDGKFLHDRVKSAVGKREFLSGITNAKRIIFSEADSLPGAIADIYDDTIVLQIFTLGTENLKAMLLDAIQDVINPNFIYERSDSPFRKIEGLKQVRRWVKGGRDTKIGIFEGGAKFIVDIEKGHKTGFYLDQRRSRLALKEISKGKRVLDLFCYTGGFSVNAALGGAKKVTAVDIKKDWLDLAEKNSTLNNVSDITEFIKGDSFQIARNICDSKERFDIIIVDPPSFIKSKKDIISATKGYKELNDMAFRILEKDGILCTFSCSHNMPNEAFSGMIKRSAAGSGKSFTILKRCRQDKDHPVCKSIPETEYLKGYFLKITS